MASIKFFEQLLLRSRRHQIAGNLCTALTLLKKLAAFPDLPQRTRTEVLARMGTCHLRRRRWARARRVLAEAVKMRPRSAHLHYLLGLSCHLDPSCMPAEGLKHFLASLRLQPRQTRCLSRAGLLLVARGNTARGLKFLHRAATLAPTDALMVKRLSEGLMQAGRAEEASRAVREAMFRVPRCQKLRRVWVDLQMARLRRSQDPHLASGSEGERPVILPFIRVVDESRGTERLVRVDRATSLSGPHLVRLRSPRGGRRRAP
ncbi:MAG: tetratricopeptide repeat protein [Gemmataceae bacterium]